MPDRFVQIVITRNQDGTFHVTWQDEHQVVKSGDYWGIGGIVTESAGKMEVPSQERCLAKA